MSFYSLVYNVDPGQQEDGYQRQNVIVTPNRATGDLLFRYIQEQMDIADKASFKRLRRLSPQIWTWAGEDNEFEIAYACRAINLGTAKGNKEYLRNLQGKVFLCTSGHEFYATAATILPPFDELKDHLSGDTFCVRNKRARQRYWFKPGTQEGDPGLRYVQPSTEYRSKFKIKIANKPRDGTLMVEDDDVNLYLVHDGVDYLMTQDKWGRIGTKKEDNALILKFGDLLNGAFVSDVDEGDKERYVWYVPAEGNKGLSGEVWELC
ncbi:hypothetical protein BJX96DRAFT_180459 [Aspergillus floccosus]